MKKIKKIISIMLVAVMALAMSMTAFAQEKEMNPADPDNATITINNPAKGETYSLYKLFDATTNGTQIAYQATSIPSQLENYFDLDASGNVSAKEGINDSDLMTALESWANSPDVKDKPTVKEESNGSALKFSGLPYGYYVMTTSHKSDPVGGAEAKSAITVTSTKPDAEINDKNVNEPNAVKTVEKESYSIGDTVKYKATFDTTNYMGEGENAKQVVNYVIDDTLPEFLDKDTVKITSIKIGKVNEETGKLDDENLEFGSTDETQFGSVVVKDDKGEEITKNNAILIPWAEKNEDNNYTSKYSQGVKIQIEYEAVLTSTTNINKDDKNTITIQPYVDKGGDDPGPWSETWHDDAVIKTYAAAINKVDQDNKPLAGATFKIKGLQVEDVLDANGKLQAGIYRVTKYDSSENAKESVELSTDANGKLYIVGLAGNVQLTVTEFKAPDGYNKLTETKTLSAQKLTEAIYETSGTKYYDKDGNLVKEEKNAIKREEKTSNLSSLDAKALKITNQQGSLLPSTGGIGTTIFYIVGAILVIGAGIILVARKRMSHEQ